MFLWLESIVRLWLSAVHNIRHGLNGGHRAAEEAVGNILLLGFCPFPPRPQETMTYSQKPKFYKKLEWSLVLQPYLF
jgi:hypothetical protein